MWAGCVSWWDVDIADCDVLAFVKVYSESMYLRVDGVNVLGCVQLCEWDVVAYECYEAAPRFVSAVGADGSVILNVWCWRACVEF